MGDQETPQSFMAALIQLAHLGVVFYAIKKPLPTGVNSAAPRKTGVVRSRSIGQKSQGDLDTYLVGESDLIGAEANRLTHRITSMRMSS